METKEFKNGLIVKTRKRAVIFEATEHIVEYMDKRKKHQAAFLFSEEDFLEFIDYMETAATNAWGNLNPRDATSEASDYWEYYDKELDNNGYLTFGDKQLVITRPFLNQSRFYRFNKRKMETFLYDLQKYKRTVQET